MVERTAVDVEQRAVPHIAEPVPNHIGKARIGDRVDHLAAVDGGRDQADRRDWRKTIAAGADHKLRRRHSAEIDALKEMDMTGDRHPYASRHEGAESKLLHMTVDIILRLAEHAAHGIERTVAGDPGLRRHLAITSANWFPDVPATPLVVPVGIRFFDRLTQSAVNHSGDPVVGICACAASVMSAYGLSSMSTEVSMLLDVVSLTKRYSDQLALNDVSVAV